MLPPLKSQTAVQVYDTNTIALPWPTGPAPRCLRLRPAPSESGCCARLPESAVTVLLWSLGTCSTYSSEFPQAQGNGWWNPARVAWVGPGEPDGPNSKKPKSDREKANRTASEIIGRSRAAATCAAPWAVSRPALADGDGRGPGWLPHTHTDQTWRWDHWWRLNGNAVESRPASSVPKESPAG